MKNLEKLFSDLNINYSNIGFYDSPEFIACEERNYRFLEKYGEFILKRDYSSEYIEKASFEIPYIASMMNEILREDKRLGACVDISGGLHRILEKEGFWSYIVKGSLTIEFPPILKVTNKHFWTLDNSNRDFLAAHAWIVAPPFNIIDISVKQQPYKDNASNYLPDIICSKSTKIASYTEEDIATPSVIKELQESGYFTNYMELYKDNWNEFKTIFKAIEHNEDNLLFKYIPTAITVPIEPLEDLQGYKPTGKSFMEIYEDIIKPKLEQIRNSKK